MPKLGRTTVRAQSVSVPCARQGQHDEGEPTAQDEEVEADERADDVRRDRDRRQAEAAAASGVRPRRAGARRREAIGSDLHDDREDHRPSLRPLVQVARHRVLDLAP